MANQTRIDPKTNPELYSWLKHLNSKEVFFQRLKYDIQCVP